LSYVSGFNAADPAKVGVHWLVKEMRAEEKIDGSHTFRPATGYRELIEVFRQESTEKCAEIHTGTIVETVRWTQNSAEIDAIRGGQKTTFAARCVLVTLPLGVLLATPEETGTVHFIPDLPRRKMEAMRKLEMGKVIRITLRFRTRFWDTIVPNLRHAKTLSNMSVLFSQDACFPTWWTTMPEKLPLITGWAPFHSAERLSGKSQSFVAQHALHTLSQVLKVPLSQLETLLEAAYSHDWQSDPFSRGAYSYGKVGADGAQQTIAEPIEGTVFFAGEATDTTGHNGTVHGAIASGYRAAQQIEKSF
jgi:monoamine oxidase